MPEEIEMMRECSRFDYEGSQRCVLIEERKKRRHQAGESEKETDDGSSRKTE